MRKRIELKAAVNRAQLGFTLVEATIVIIILGILSALGSSFVISSMESYNTVEQRSDLMQRGRISIEQITRELHMSLPNGVRISGTGNCVEFLPIVASASYQSNLPDTFNAVSATNSIATSSFDIDSGTAKHVVVGAFTPTEVYTNASPASHVAIGALGTAPYSAVPLSSSHRFVRNSVNKRVFLTDDPVRYCLSAGNLVRYSAYGFLTTAMGDSEPGGDSDLVSLNVAAISGESAFALSPGSQDTNIALFIKLEFSNATESVDLNHKVLIRNVP